MATIRIAFDMIDIFSGDSKQVTTIRMSSYSKRFILRLTSLVTEFVREVYPPEPNLPTGSDSAETT